ncbi:hypothetical protein [Nonomuraea sp. NPDC050643]|uniref:hypothetical protein n=1 Tax=Nonomuraea sp. NPDC050643 TaxID=3155660 RepID=UPI0033E859B1
MTRTALLLGTMVLGGLLAAPPAFAAPAVEVAVAQVEATPSRQAGNCPTTVGFSALVTAQGKGTVRYRWIRGDGSRSAVKSLRVNGTRRAVVADRQTFDRPTSGWQAVEVLGKEGLSARARFDVTCPAAPQTGPLPARPGGPLTAAASVVVSPPAHSGPCPATLTFTGTVQVSRTPAKVDYRWIDGATGEGRLESLAFPAGGPRVRQVVLPLSVGDPAAGWKAIRLLTPGQDSGRAAYEVTCKANRASRPPISSPTPSPTLSPRPGTPRPIPTTPTPAPTTPIPTTPAPTSPPPVQRPEPRIVGVTPGDYEGDCLEPIAYQAAGRVSLPAGPAAKVTYQWILDGAAWQRQVLDFPAADQPRAQDVSAAWTLGWGGDGTHTLGLMTDGGPAEPVTRQFTFACTDRPGDARLRFQHLLTPVFHGECDGSIGLRGDGLVTTDREAEVKYRLIVDGVPGPIRSEVLKPGVKHAIGDFWYSSLRTSGSGVVRLEVLNHNRPFVQETYSLTCEPPNPAPGPVELTELWGVAYHGTCVDPPYVTAHGTFKAAPGTAITYRWVTDGRPAAPHTLKVGESGILEVQAAYWERPEREDGTVALEVLDHDKPGKRLVYPVTCRS